MSVTARVRITRCTVAGSPAGIRGVGEILTVPEAEARELVRLGKAVRVALEPLPAEVGAPTVQHAEPPRPTRTRGR